MHQGRVPSPATYAQTLVESHDELLAPACTYVAARLVRSLNLPDELRAQGAFGPAILSVNLKLMCRFLLRMAFLPCRRELLLSKAGPFSFWASGPFQEVVAVSFSLLTPRPGRELLCRATARQQRNLLPVLAVTLRPVHRVAPFMH